jgi:hypothetical protein
MRHLPAGDIGGKDMKPWTAERTARALPFFLIASGALAVGLGAFLAYCTAKIGVVDSRDLSIVAVGTSFLVQSAGVLFYLRIRGKRGMRWLLVISFLSLVPPLVLFAVTSMEFGGEFGAYAFLLMGLPLCSAILTHLLVARRIEPGDESPLLMSAAAQRGMPAWGEVVGILLLCAAVYFLFDFFF